MISLASFPITRLFWCQPDYVFALCSPERNFVLPTTRSDPDSALFRDPSRRRPSSADPSSLRSFSLVWRTRCAIWREIAPDDRSVGGGIRLCTLPSIGRRRFLLEYFLSPSDDSGSWNGNQRCSTNHGGDGISSIERGGRSFRAQQCHIADRWPSVCGSLRPYFVCRLQSCLGQEPLSIGTLSRFARERRS